MDLVVNMISVKQNRSERASCFERGKSFRRTSLQLKVSMKVLKSYFLDRSLDIYVANTELNFVSLQ